MAPPLDDDPLKNIIFISMPEDFERSIGSLTVGSSILMPVELPPGGQEWTPGELSWEMIVAGMLKILAYQPEHKDADYYRNFIMEVKPTIVEELSNTGILKARNRDFDVAEEIFKALSNLLPRDTNSLLNLALVYEEHAEAYEQIGNERLREVCAERAFEAYKRAIVLDPESPEVHYNAGYFHLRQRNYSKVIEHFTAYLERDGKSERAERVRQIIEELRSHDLLDNLFKEAYDFIRLGKEREGIEKITGFLDAHPDVWNAWFLLGWAHRRLGEYEAGREAFERAIKLGSAETDTYNELAICLMEIGDLVESREQLMHALQREPENTKILSNLGIVSMKEKKLEEAIGYFEAVREIEPDDPVAQKYLEILAHR
jgi:tetratricopeptide (TPR) repeat protein